MRTDADGRRSEHMAALRSVLQRKIRTTRTELSKETGLSTMTVGKLLAVMETRGEVFQRETERGTAGRPSTIAQYNAEYAHFAVIVVEQRQGRSVFEMSVRNLLGEPVMKESLTIEVATQECLDGFFKRVQTREYRLALAVIVLPGVADGETMISCDLQAFVDGQVIKRIRQLFGIQVLFENDVNAAVFGHAFEQNEGICAGMYFPKNYCPGAGVVVDGEILYGKGNFTGEIGYIDGIKSWETLNYKDIQAVSVKIGRLLTIYACVMAPQKMVLYGDFFMPEMVAAIQSEFARRMMGRFSMELSFADSMTRDMELGAKKLGRKKMFEWLCERD